MEASKYVIIFATCFLALPIFAYNDQTTHPELTNEAVKLFNQNYYSLKISSVDLVQIKQGSIDEDVGIRALEHFYDPIYNRGLTVAGLAKETSKGWSVDTRGQGGFVLGPNNYLAGTVTSYFSADSDYSWDRAVYEYVHGDKNRGLQTLGHVLHLIQDASVPDHTRNDQHLTYAKDITFGLNDQDSLYERYTTDPEGIDQIANELISAEEKPIIYSNLGQYFDNLATYSNNNFFSRDTTPDKDKEYKSPVVVKENDVRMSDGKIYIIGSDYDGRLLVLVDRKINLDTGSFDIKYYINDVDYKILADYWSHLSKQAVLNSAGVIKLFFDEVEKEKRTGALAAKNKSLLARVVDATLAVVGLASKKATVNSANLTGAVIQTKTTPAEPPLLKKEGINTDQPTQDQIDVMYHQLVSLRQQIELLQGTLSGTPDLGVIDQAKQSTLALARQMQSGGGGAASQIGTQVEQIIETGTSSVVRTIVAPPIILEPANLNQTFSSSITFRGTTSTSSLIVFTDLASTTSATSSAQGEWELTLSVLPAGTTTINFYARDNEGNISDPATITIFIAETPVVALTMSIAECAQTWIPGHCVIPKADNLSVSWQMTPAGEYGYQVVNEEEEWSDTADAYVWVGKVLVTANSLQTTIASPRDPRIGVVARDVEGNEVASSSVTKVDFHPHPLVINEIGWRGTSASTTLDEWIELYNDSEYDIDLTGFVLRDASQKELSRLSGSIGAQSYYLIERGDDNVISDVSADLVSDLGAPGGTEALPDSGFYLELAGPSSDGSLRVYDKTPANFNPQAQCTWDECQTQYFSFERRQANKDGDNTNNWDFAGLHNQKNGHDRNGGELIMTPRRMNGASVPVMW